MYKVYEGGSGGKKANFAAIDDVAFPITKEKRNYGSHKQKVNSNGLAPLNVGVAAYILNCMCDVLE